MNISRILEALIIAAITASIVLYATVQVISADMKTMQRDIQRMEQSINQINRDIYKPAYRGND